MPRTLYRDVAIADGSGPDLSLGMSVLVADDRIEWIEPVDAEPELANDVEVIDASGCTVVPGLVDCHSHLTLQGGAHWLERSSDPPERLVDVAEHNAKLLRSAGVRWARDVGAPIGADPVDGRTRALSLGVRDRWTGKREYPYVRAAGTWIARTGTFPDKIGLEVEGADLVGAAMGQLDDGAD